METKDKVTPEALHTVPVCRACGSEHVVCDAWACFNRESGLWELENVYDDAHCHTCEEATKLDWIPADALQNRRVQALNDRFRKTGLGNGSIMVTQGVQEQGAEFVVAAVCAVRLFNEFSEDNDPWGEHDFGAIELQGQKVFWKIDYYDRSLTQGSENPANDALTHRVLTIMLASEY
ncbi:DUF3768 domain-containing protein [Yoonia sp. GPGPB17]|uniref:DUF3768 domain-containing protein n=1 Tax=Yoonia sp. GPGPB17 TaxID=3026147 RepID=UPI0030BE8020